MDVSPHPHWSLLAITIEWFRLLAAVGFFIYLQLSLFFQPVGAFEVDIRNK